MGKHPGSKIFLEHPGTTHLDISSLGLQHEAVEGNSTEFSPEIVQENNIVDANRVLFVKLTKFNKYFTGTTFLNAKDITEGELLKRCIDLEKLLSRNELKDVSGTDLFEEMKYLRNHYKRNYSSRNILDFISSNNLNAALGNLFVSLRILLFLPVSVATAERSFSKMKLIKKYIRSTITQNRMDGLAMLSIEQAIAKELDLEGMIKSFAIVKARKVKL
ncbi:uncharacterized protein LOC136079290 [Hydra vulgaris]|uniref:Uncharacterized protein LOC136079290 n=1 Tax=Hydra vulgaris TaxID=6087 RepID=A0ABM4BPN8_HYDVU